MNASDWKQDSVMCEKKKNSENLAGIFYFHFHIDKELLGVLPFSITNTIKHKVSLAQLY